MKLKLIEFLLRGVNWIEERLIWIKVKELIKERKKQDRLNRQFRSKRVHVTTTGDSW